jgi:hypothetical protein
VKQTACIRLRLGPAAHHQRLVTRQFLQQGEPARQRVRGGMPEEGTREEQAREGQVRVSLAVVL